MMLEFCSGGALDDLMLGEGFLKTLGQSHVIGALKTIVLHHYMINSGTKYWMSNLNSFNTMC